MTYFFIDGSALNISYMYSIGADNSLFSPEISFYCASLPDPPLVPNLIWKDPSRVKINWFPSLTGGSTILGYLVYMKLSTDSSTTLIYDGSFDPNTNYLTINSFNNAALLTDVIYQISIRARNIVGIGGYSATLNFVLGNYPSSINSVINGLSQLFSGYVSTLNLKVTFQNF